MWTYNTGSGEFAIVAVSGVPPKPRCGHSMSKVPNIPAVVIFGGSDGIDHFDDLWMVRFDKNWKGIVAKVKPGYRSRAFAELLKPLSITGDPHSTDFLKFLGLVPDRPDPLPNEYDERPQLANPGPRARAFHNAVISPGGLLVVTMGELTHQRWVLIFSNEQPLIVMLG